MLGGPRERSGFPPPSGGFTPSRCGLLLLRRSQTRGHRALRWLLVSVIGLQTGIAALTFVDWDGRHLIAVLPVIMVLSAYGAAWI